MQTIAPAECGSPNSNHKVVDKVAPGAAADAQCPDDGHFDFATGGSLCLHVNWVVGSCIEWDPRYPQHPRRIACCTRGVNVYEVTQILPNKTDVNDCNRGTTGFVDYTHRFVTCLVPRH